MRRPSPSMIVAVVALILATTAAVLITGKQVKDGSLTGKDLKKGSITADRLKKGVIPAATTLGAAKPGDPGPAGPQGPRARMAGMAWTARTPPTACRG